MISKPTMSTKSGTSSRAMEMMAAASMAQARGFHMYLVCVLCMCMCAYVCLKMLSIPNRRAACTLTPPCESNRERWSSTKDRTRTRGTGSNGAAAKGNDTCVCYTTLYTTLPLSNPHSILTHPMSTRWITYLGSTKMAHSPDFPTLQTQSPKMNR